MYLCVAGINFEGDGHSTTFTSTEGRSSPAVSESSQCMCLFFLKNFILRVRLQFEINKLMLQT